MTRNLKKVEDLKTKVANEVTSPDDLGLSFDAKKVTNLYWFLLSALLYKFLLFIQRECVLYIWYIYNQLSSICLFSFVQMCEKSIVLMFFFKKIKCFTINPPIFYL